MKVKQSKMWATALVCLFVLGVLIVYAQIAQRPLNQRGLTEGMSFGTAFPTVANDGRPPFPGEPFVLTGGANDMLHVYDDTETDWNTVMVNERAFDASIWREDFLGPISMRAIENDGTAAVVTDGGVNLLLIESAGNLNMMSYRLEQALAATPAPLTTWGVFTMDGYVDDVTNDGILWTFMADNQASGFGATYNETSSASMYCEMQVDTANISAVDDAWFGWVSTDATDNPPASADYDTAALFTIVDATGDVNITTMLNNAAEGSDDTAVDMADGDQFIFRVTIAADSVSFAAELDDAGSTVSAIAQTNATLDADDDDEFKCVYGFTNAANESYGITINYVEIGYVQ